MTCPHCDRPSVWDSVLECWAHPSEHPLTLIVCHEPWRPRLPMARATFEVSEGVARETGGALAVRNDAWRARG